MFPFHIEEIIIMSPNTSHLPPEMQQRIAEIMGAAPAAPSPPPAAVATGALVPTRKPSLMESVENLRGEIQFLQGQINAMGQQMRAVAQVSEATGQAVAELYQTFIGPIGEAPTHREGGTDEF
jgi:hypothetical protein